MNTETWGIGGTMLIGIIISEGTDDNIIIGTDRLKRIELNEGVATIEYWDKPRVNFLRKEVEVRRVKFLDNHGVL